VTAAASALTFDEFCDYLERSLVLDHVPRNPAILLAVDLGFDSISVLEMTVAVEDLGVEFAESDIDGFRRIGDVYAAYVRLRHESLT